MKDGDTVIVTADTEDHDRRGVLRGQAEIVIGHKRRVFRIVRFADGHEGAYEDWELRVLSGGERR